MYGFYASEDRMIGAINKALKGTTTVGFTCSDGIILATDRRAISGHFIAHKRVRKIWRIDEHIAATMAGVVADAQKIMDRLSLHANLYKIERRKPISVRSVSALASTLLMSVRPHLFVVQTIIAGIDEGGPSMYSIDWLGSITMEKYIATGSGSPIAIGILEDAFSDNITVDKGVPIVIRAVRSALKRDPGSGEGIDVVVISTKDGYHELTEEEVRKIIAGSC